MFTKLKTILCGSILVGAIACAPAAQASSYLFTSSGADYSVSALFDQAGLSGVGDSTMMTYSGNESVTLSVTAGGTTQTQTFDAYVTLSLTSQSDPIFGDEGDIYLRINDALGGYFEEDVDSGTNFTSLTDAFSYALATGDYGFVGIDNLAGLIGFSSSPANVSLATVPEPAALGLLVLGLAGIAASRRRKPV